MRLKALIFLLTLPFSTLAQAQSAPARYDVILENEKIAAFRLDLAAHQRAPVYQNTHEVLWVALQGGNVTVTRQDNSEQRLALSAGDVRFYPSFQTKAIMNEGATEFHGVLIQIKPRGLTWNPCECLGKAEQSVCGCNTADRLPSLWAVGLGGVTVGGTTLAPGQAFLGAGVRGDTLLLALTPVQLVDLAAPGREKIRLQPGEAQWVPRGSHKFQNVGDAPARYVTVEF